MSNGSYEGPERIAVVGLAGRFPGAPDVDAFWRNLRSGVESIAFFTDEELLREGADPALLARPEFVRAFGYLEGADLFDADFFELPPREAEILDPQHRLFLEQSWAALEHAGCDPERYAGPIGVFAGCNQNSYLMGLVARHGTRGADLLHSRIRSDKDFLSTLVSYKLNLRGPSLSVQTACSTSLVAIHLACQSLLDFQCDLALAGGVSVQVPLKSGHLSLEGGIFSPDGHCRSFDARGAGTLGGSGVGVVVLKRLSEALADGDHVHAVVLGSAVNNDGAAKVGFTAPSVEGQIEVVSLAHAVAEVDPETIGYVEAHGTATPLGDPIEVAALTRAFDTPSRRYCALGSVKSNVGHLDAAAGVASFIKTVLALEHREIPPSLHFSEPNPNIDFAGSPFFVNDRLRPWLPRGGAPRRAGVSSFGMGGTNAHVVLEEAPPLPAAPAEEGPETVVLSARTPAALERLGAALAERLESDPGLRLGDVAATLQRGRRAFPHRRALAAESTREAAELLRARHPSRVVTREAAPQDPGVVFLFPGAGSAFPGMGRGLYEREPAFRAALDRCSEILRARWGVDLHGALHGGREGALESARPAHAAVFSVGYALAETWRSRGVEPRAVLGHDVGEYAAACVAGVFTLEDALALVVRRAGLVESLPRAAALAVALEAERLRGLVREIAAGGHEPAVVAVSGPHSAVVSGSAAGVALLAERVRAAGGAARPLAIPHPLHSEALAPLRESFAAVVSSLARQAPALPLASGLTGEWLRAEQAQSVEYWVEHLLSPVRLDLCVERVRSAGEEPVLLELGAGRVLEDRARLRGAARVVGSLAEEPGADARVLQHALGYLWSCGVPVEWSRGAGGARRRVVLPGHPLERRRYWIDAAPAEATEAAGAAPNGLYAPAWGQLPALPRPAEGALAGRRVVAFVGPAAAPLTARLRALGAEVVEVRAGAEYREEGGDFALRPAAREDHLRLAAALRERGGPAPHTLHLWQLEDGAGETLEEALERGPYALGHWLEALRSAGLLQPGAVMAAAGTGAQAVLGSEALRPARAALAGALRGAAHDHPGLRCRSVDLEPGGAWEAQLPAELVELLAREGGAEAVAYRGRMRWAPRHAELPAAEPGSGAPLRRRGTYLVTGGLEGTGLELARLLAGRAEARLALLYGEEEAGRLDAAVRELEAAGAEVLPLPAGVADEDALRAALARVEERFGALHGVVHAAGSTPGEGVRGALALDGALGAAPLDFLLLRSSLHLLSGGAGAAEHCAAEALLDALAAERSYGRGLPTTCVSLAPGLSPPEGAELLARALESGGAPAVAASPGDPAVLVERARRAAHEPPAGAPSRPGRHPRPRLATPYVAPRTELEVSIAGVYERELGIEGVGVDDDFFELGGDSLLATQLVAALNDTFGVQMPLRVAFESPTPAQLARAVVGHQVEQVDEALLAEVLAEL